MNDDDWGLFLALLTLIAIWIYQSGVGGEQVFPATVQWAEQACAPNGGLDYIRHELFERMDYVCQTGAEGIIEEYIESQKGEMK